MKRSVGWPESASTQSPLQQRSTRTEPRLCYSVQAARFHFPSPDALAPTEMPLGHGPSSIRQVSLSPFLRSRDRPTEYMFGLQANGHSVLYAPALPA